VVPITIEMHALQSAGYVIHFVGINRKPPGTDGDS